MKEILLWCVVALAVTITLCVIFVIVWGTIKNTIRKLEDDK